MEVMIAVQIGTLLRARCSESAAQKKSFLPQRRGLQRSPSGDPEEESPNPEQLRDAICEQVFCLNKALASEMPML